MSCGLGWCRVALDEGGIGGQILSADSKWDQTRGESSFFLEHGVKIGSILSLYAPVRLRISQQKQGKPAARNISFEQECESFFADVVQVLGVPKSVGQIYGLLYGSPDPLSLSDIVERLEISKGCASQGLQLLRSLGAIHEADAKSEIADSRSQNLSRMPRGTSYVPELGLRKLIGGVLREQVAPLALTSDDRLKRLGALAAIADGCAGDFYVDRAEQLNTWRKRLKTVLPALSLLLGSESRAKK